MNLNSGKRVDEVDRFSVESSRFVRLDRFQGLSSVYASCMGGATIGPGGHEMTPHFQTQGGGQGT